MFRHAFAAALAAAALVFSVAAPARAEFQAAAAARDITPEKQLGASSGGPGRPTTEKKGKLETRILVLADKDTRVAIISEPFLGFPAALIAKIAAKVEGIPAENIIVGATHVHSAPDPYCFPTFGVVPGCDIDYLNWVCEQTADGVNEAVKALKPASLKIATDKAAPKIAYNYYAPQLYDPRVHVIQAIGADGKAIGTLVNYAVHPEILIDKPYLSPDLIGPLYDEIARQNGGVGVFMNSAEGGMVTADNRADDPMDKDKERNDWDECVRIGTLLGSEALRIVAGATVQADPGLVCVAKTVNFPLPTTNPQWKIVAKGKVGFKINADNSIDTRINLINVGNAQILTIPGEALPNIGFYLKRKMHGENNMLFGLTNDAFGYILTKVDFNSFDRYKYCSETSLGEMTGEIYIEEALKLADSIPPPAKLAGPPPAAPGAGK